jgi:hypothetical protein
MTAKLAGMVTMEPAPVKEKPKPVPFCVDCAHCRREPGVIQVDWTPVYTCQRPESQGRVNVDRVTGKIVRPIYCESERAALIFPESAMCGDQGRWFTPRPPEPPPMLPAVPPPTELELRQYRRQAEGILSQFLRWFLRV